MLETFAITLLLLVAIGPLATRATLVVLGDSFSDAGQQGNIPVAATGGILPGTTLVNERLSTGQSNVGFYPPAPYYYGRFSNGPVWIEYAASLLGQAADNLAAGGANGADTGGIGIRPPFGFVTSDVAVPVRSIVAQAQAYAALKATSYGLPGARAFQDIVILQIGPDEYFQKLAFPEITSPINTSQITDTVRQALEITYNVGVRKFVLVNLPPVSAFPFSADNSSSARNDIDVLVEDQNSQFEALAADFNSTFQGAQVLQYDLAGLFEQVITDPSNEAWGGAFTNTEDACRDGNLDDVQVASFNLQGCTNPEGYLWWDVVHPTKHFHNVWGQDFVAQLRPFLDANLIVLADTTSPFNPYGSA